MFTSGKIGVKTIPVSRTSTLASCTLASRITTISNQCPYWKQGQSRTRLLIGLRNESTLRPSREYKLIEIRSTRLNTLLSLSSNQIKTWCRRGRTAKCSLRSGQQWLMRATSTILSIPTLNQLASTMWTWESFALSTSIHQHLITTKRTRTSRTKPEVHLIITWGSLNDRWNLSRKKEGKALAIVDRCRRWKDLYSKIVEDSDHLK